MLGWLADSWFSCRKYTERVSRSMDEPLCAWERAGLLFHHCICFFCRRFHRQLHQMEKDLKHYPGFVEQDEHHHVLSEDARLRILENLRNKI